MVINRACERVANECSLPKTARPDVVIIQAPLLALELVRRPPDDRQRRFDGIRCMDLSVSMISIESRLHLAPMVVVKICSSRHQTNGSYRNQTYETQ